MAVKTNSRLESTPAGVVNPQALIEANWQQLEDILTPGLSSGNTVYNLLTKALTRNATLPTGRARLEWLAGSPGKPVFRPNHATIVYAGTVTFDMDGAVSQTCVLTGNLIVQLSALAEGQEITLYLEASGGARTPTWPASIRWLSGAAPGAIPSGKILAVTFRSRGTTAANVVATFTLEP